MSDQLVKIGLTCAVIVLSAGVLGSQLSNSPGLLQSAIGHSEESADKTEHAKKAPAAEVDEEADDDTEEADEDVAAEDSAEVGDEADADAAEVAAEDGEEAASDADEVAAEESPDESEGDVSQPEEPAPDAGESETADTGSEQGDDGEIVYNGVPAGAVTEEDE
jgi:hypothetical protein